MTIQQTIDIPANWKVHFDLVLPETVPCGRTDVILDFPQETVSRSGGPNKSDTLDPVLEKALKEAEEKRLYHQTYPAELRESLKRLQEGGPLFGGIGAGE